MNFWILVYLLTVAMGAGVAYKRFSVAWRRRERARVTIGVLCVLVPALLAGAGGLLDMLTVVVVFAGFGVAGAVTLYFDIDGEVTASSLARQTFED